MSEFTYLKRVELHCNAFAGKKANRHSGADVLQGAVIERSLMLAATWWAASFVLF